MQRSHNKMNFLYSGFCNCCTEYVGRGECIAKSDQDSRWMHDAASSYVSEFTHVCWQMCEVG